MSKNVTIYSTPMCPYCTAAKQFLKQNNIAFTDMDVSASEAAARELEWKSGQIAVPVFDVDGEIIVGFDKRKLSKALGIAQK